MNLIEEAKALGFFRRSGHKYQISLYLCRNTGFSARTIFAGIMIKTRHVHHRAAL